METIAKTNSNGSETMQLEMHSLTETTQINSSLISTFLNLTVEYSPFFVIHSKQISMNNLQVDDI